MQSIDAFMPRLIPQVLGCPVPLARQALVDAAIDFCEQTCVVTMITEPMPLVAGVARYELDLPTGTAVGRILQVWVGNRPLYSVSGPDINLFVGTAANVLMENQQEPRGQPTAAWYGGDALNLLPTPDQTAYGSITARLALRLTVNATQVPDELAFRWTDAIVNGALYRLAQTSGQPFTDASVAMLARADYYRALGRARIEFNRAGMAQNLATNARPFA